MSDIGEKEREELEMLMPWYVNGTLDRASSQRIEEALKSDPVLLRSLAVLGEDLDATIALAEADELPASMEARFMAQLDAEPDQRMARAKAAATPGIMSSVGSWIGEFVAAMTPGRLAVAAAVACLVVALQTGVIVSLIGQNSGFETASGPGAVTEGPSVLVQFAPGADLAAITAFLDETKGRIVDGPLPGGMFRLAFDPVDDADAEAIATKLRGEPALFALVLPSN